MNSKPPPSKYASGLQGQQAAETFLHKKGLTVLARNYRTRTGEIDLIARYRTYIIFIEVKARSSTSHGRPAEAVGYHKQQKIIQTARHYLNRYGLTDSDVRFDVVEVLTTVGKTEINHIEDAFWAN